MSYTGHAFSGRSAPHARASLSLSVLVLCSASPELWGWKARVARIPFWSLLWPLKVFTDAWGSSPPDSAPSFGLWIRKQSRLEYTLAPDVVPHWLLSPKIFLDMREGIVRLGQVILSSGQFEFAAIGSPSHFLSSLGQPDSDKWQEQ